MNRRRVGMATLIVLALAGVGMAVRSGYLPFGPAPGAPAPLLPTAPLFGPWSTVANHGYEGADSLTPVLPPSTFPVKFFPPALGVQFVADNPQNLKADALKIQVAGPGIQTAPTPTVGSGGMVSLPVSQVQPGRYAVTFSAPGFTNSVNHWTMDYEPAAVPWQVAPNTIMLDTLNAFRRDLGEAPVTWNLALARAAQAHADYLAQNGYNAPSFHEESAGRPGFVGASPWNRDLTFGWTSALTGEVGIEWSKVMASPLVVADFVNTIYHRLAILTPNLEWAGGGLSRGATGAEVMDLGYSYRSNLPPVVVYPYPNQSGVPTGWVDVESPDPVHGGFGKELGYPITAEFPTVNRLSGVKVAVYANYTPVAVAIDLPGSGGMSENQVGVVPRHPLAANTVYTVRLSAQALFNDGTHGQVGETWRFATGGSDAAVTAIPQGDRLWVGVDEAGLGKPVPRTVVAVRRLGKAQIVSRGSIVNGQGVLSMPPHHSPQKRYWVSTEQGNGMVIWW